MAANDDTAPVRPLPSTSRVSRCALGIHGSCWAVSFSASATAAAAHIRRCAYSDPAAAADAAWAAADTLYVATRALRSPALRCAADAYDRAARAGYGRIPAAAMTGTACAPRHGCWP